ncbi:putative carbohydrate-binding module family 1 protein [Rosellinia necatrix]|uniref:Putative carbohydrate-binding module family 1 protein n=1 Tax=Rosellinia necatrix TaxID=77044 RepID=A0A1S8A975_ROSNE|nr:putative carbohydrate-binding module family 1 protein [Rosellinia necatrix]
MNPTTHDLPSTATCTSCTPVEDFSNYWTATLFFRARNGTLHRVDTFGNELGYTGASGGQTVYYLSSGKVTAFKPGFRMTVGDPNFRTAAQLQAKYKYMDFTCLQTSMTRGGQTLNFPTRPCPAGIMVSIRFPTCWDGKNTDSPDHQSHVAYPNGNACPASHPVTVPQVFYET